MGLARGLGPPEAKAPGLVHARFHLHSDRCGVLSGDTRTAIGVAETQEGLPAFCQLICRTDSPPLAGWNAGLAPGIFLPVRKLDTILATAVDGWRPANFQ